MDHLSADLLRIVLGRLDCLALLRAARACNALRTAASDTDLWQRHLLDFFDGELPPAEMLPAGLAHPREVLCEQLKFARQATKLESELKHFLLCRMEEQEEEELKRREWKKDMDSKVAAKQGKSYAYYGAAGGEVGVGFRAYGRYRKAIYTHCASEMNAGVSEAEARLVFWAKLERKHLGGKQRTIWKYLGMQPHEYAAIAAWLARVVGGHAEACGAGFVVRKGTLTLEEPKRGLYGGKDKRLEGEDEARIAQEDAENELNKELNALPRKDVVCSACGSRGQPAVSWSRMEFQCTTCKATSLLPPAAPFIKRQVCTFLAPS